MIIILVLKSFHAIKSCRIFFLNSFLILKVIFVDRFLFEKNFNAPIPDQEYTYVKTLIPEAVGGIELLRRF